MNEPGSGTPVADPHDGRAGDDKMSHNPVQMNLDELGRVC